MRWLAVIVPVLLPALLAVACSGRIGRAQPAPLVLARFDAAPSVAALREDCPFPATGTLDFGVTAAADGDGNVLSLSWAMAPGARAPLGVRIDLDAVDLGGFDHLVVRARSGSDDAVRGLHVGLRRPHPANGRLREAGSAPLPEFGRAWRTVRLPLAHFIGLSGLSGIDELVVLAEPSASAATAGRVEIAEVVALRTGEVAAGPWDRPEKPDKRAFVARHGGAAAAEAAVRARARELPPRVETAAVHLPTDPDTFLRRVAADTWRGLDGLRDRDTGLPFDTVRVDAGAAGPDIHIGDYTSVTNVGLYLMAVAAARELGFVDAAAARERAAALLATLARLETHAGFPFNYYDTTTGERGSHFVSFIDAAWLAAGLIVVRNAFPELAAAATALLDRGDFGFFHDPRSGLMNHGYFVHLDRPSPFHYGLFYTEARLGSLIAIGRGDVPEEHWFRMLRVFPESCAWQAQRPEPLPPLEIDGVRIVRGVYRHGELRFVPSWGGSMFEALMPLLVVDERRLAPASLGRNAEAHVALQRSWGEPDAPWGRSPCRDVDGGYGEFGVPALGVLGYADDVVSPHAAALALAVDPEAATANLQRLAAVPGLYGDFGFHDGYAPATGRVARAYLALDQAMLLLALANHLGDGVVRGWFEADPEIAPVLPLLARENFFE